jgi:two-component system, NarL family, sensor histidine kinase UhpB
MFANVQRDNVLGDKDRFVPPCKGNGTDVAAWTDMLSMIGAKNSQLYRFVVRDSRGSGRTIVRELERERSRIARELHAGAGQPLAGIKLNLEMLDDYAAVLPQAGRDALARLQTLASQALEQVRAVSHSLHPPDWQGLTTGDALLYLLRSSGLTGRLEVEIDIRPLPIEPSHTVKIAIYRCAQECISNVVRHSGAARFALALIPLGRMVELRLEDNGRGFPQEHSAGNPGIGLRAIREHTLALGGVCRISSGGDGVRIGR